MFETSYTRKTALWYVGIKIFYNPDRKGKIISLESRSRGLHRIFYWLHEQGFVV
jgi:hypothetical protein